MLKIENTEVMGWEHAIRGMRNPKNSWEKTDSYPAVDCGKCGKIEREGICKKEDRDCTGFECFEVGPNDLKLMTTLRIMNYFLAVNDRQLGTCLRMLFAEKLQPAVQTVLNEKGKIEFHISIAADQEVFEELNERYKIMIS